MDRLEHIEWAESPHGFWYNNGDPEKVAKLQRAMVDKGFDPPVILCHRHGGNLYFTPKDREWAKVISGELDKKSK